MEAVYIQNMGTARVILIVSIIVGIMALIGIAIGFLCLGVKLGAERFFMEGYACGQTSVIFILGKNKICSYEDMAKGMGMQVENMRQYVAEHVEEADTNNTGEAKQ